MLRGRGSALDVLVDVQFMNGVIHGRFADKNFQCHISMLPELCSVMSDQGIADQYVREVTRQPYGREGSISELSDDLIPGDEQFADVHWIVPLRQVVRVSLFLQDVVVVDTLKVCVGRRAGRPGAESQYLSNEGCHDHLGAGMWAVEDHVTRERSWSEGRLPIYHCRHIMRRHGKGSSLSYLES